MATAETDKELVLSISHIARVAGVDRPTVRVLIELNGIPVVRGPNLTAVRPESRGALVEALLKHPRVARDLDERL